MTSSSDDDKELLINETIREENVITLESQSSPTNSTSYLHFTSGRKSSWTHAVSAVFVAVAAFGVTLTLPLYLDSINIKSDAYCALVMSSFSSFMSFLGFCIALKLTFPDRCMMPPIPMLVTWKLGTYLGLSNLLIFYARDRSRVLCNLQDPLTAIQLPLAVIFHFIFNKKVDSTKKLFCIAAVIIGLFICIDFQLWDGYTCHGHVNPDYSDELRMWTSEENAIWTIVYVGGLALFVLAITLLEVEMKREKPECHVATIALTSTSPTVAEVLCDDGQPIEQLHGKTTPLYSGEPEEIFIKTHIFVLCAWIQFWSLCTVLLFFWTDLFSFLGKAGSDFNRSMFDGIYCHFSFSDECIDTMMWSWTYMTTKAGLLYSIACLINCSGSCSVSYIVSLTMIALPMSSLLWALFKSTSGLHWHPSFTGEAGFTIVGFPIMIIAIMMYRRYAKKENC